MLSIVTLDTLGECMRSDELKSAFNQQAAGYDKQWAKLSPIRDCLHLLLESVFAELPAEATVLCVGVGTGAELAHLANKFPAWRFAAVEPSSAMLNLCRDRAEREGFASRCMFHEGHVDSLPPEAHYDAATCFLVSQFILERDARVGFFRGIADRLKPRAILASSDLCADVASYDFERLVQAWMRMMSAAGIPPEGLQRMREAWSKDVSILPASEVSAIIESAGFEKAVQFFQAGMIRGWFSQRSSD